jgi:hypothetical protein
MRPNRAGCSRGSRGGVEDLAAGRGDLAVVEHRVDEDLSGQRHLGAVAGQQSEAGRGSPARARPTDDEPLPFQRGVRRHPAQRGVRVVDGGGVRVLGSATPFHGHRDTPGARDEVLQERVVLGGGPEHVAAAVHPEDRRSP